VGGQAASGSAGAAEVGGSIGEGGVGVSEGGNAAGTTGSAGATHTRAEISAKYNYAPATRTVHPVAVFKTNGSVVNAQNVLNGDATAITGNGAYIVLDFGKEVGGIITLTFAAASDASQSVGLAFSESATYAGPSSDQSNGSGTPDGALIAMVSGAITYTVPQKFLRGGFRYLTVFLNSTGWVHLSGVSLDFSPDPERAVPNDYPNYFYCNDELLNQAWYGGAYTVQTTIVRNHEGRAWPPTSTNWDNSLTVGESGNSVLTDAAKRDRTVWPGDMAISLPTAYAALFDTTSSKNSLQTLYNHQDGAGQLPYAGPPMNFGGSDTYHMWTLFGTELYYLYSGDQAFLDSVWPKFKSGVAFSLGEIDASGLFNDTQTNDWARDNPGGENIQPNAILYGVLSRAVALAQAERDSALAASYAAAATTLKGKINAQLWDSSTGAYRDTPTSTLYPEDGNSLAVWFKVIDDPSQARSISYVLNENWNDIGARCPEFTFGTGTPRISSFAGSMELMSHFEAGYDRRGLDMIRNMWGFMLADKNGPQSTFWEGFDSQGNLAYQGSFTSSSHGWGSGPTSALSFYVLGVQPDTAAGQTYHVIPHPGDLTHVEGSLTMSAGKSVSVDYDVDSSCQAFSMRVDASALAGSTGTIGVPKFGASHTVLINGAPAWDGKVFTPTPGVQGASEDASYVYFDGVAPRVNTFSFSDGKSCAPAPEAWSFCSDENGTCAFTGTQRVRFGKRGKYAYKIATGSTPCDAATFTDPIPNVPKSCQVSAELYNACSVEGQTCAFTGTKQVRFGANGQWLTRTASGSTPCDAATFGDPLPNVVKRCEYRDGQ
jgi:Bacterial alpha-L-rhamnosidase 6 hairpin glycosidase domain